MRILLFFPSQNSTNTTEETTTARELTLFIEDSDSHHSSFIGLTPKFGVPLVAFLVLLSITIVYLRYKVERKSYTHMVPLYMEYLRRPHHPREQENQNRHELIEMDGLPCYALVKPPPEYQLAVHMPRPESPDEYHCAHRSDKYVLVPDQDL